MQPGSEQAELHVRGSGAAPARPARPPTQDGSGASHVLGAAADGTTTVLPVTGLPTGTGTVVRTLTGTTTVN